MGSIVTTEGQNMLGASMSISEMVDYIEWYDYSHRWKEETLAMNEIRFNFIEAKHFPWSTSQLACVN